ncbi:cadherin-like domain-containing protein [Nitratireductor aquimarinus]|uniref:cadherin-like domain-containing protein n=1 Tax=Alphaproteobacteria TaxID=28211 RepID=UPI0019D3E56C|nr:MULTISPECIES: cadherin-like domain-containing protein [Alphaproteobacteria]MBN7756650.1 cadherin-like domain-containing protein [Nitratireductor aquimarinus]MBY5999733.1 cadherin-like domain-containing protein [Tritonibacter mobilis]MBY6021759.1 cadherin-like domain-containing protein [Nitratireductor sp. DP7N14-4]
MIDVKGSKTQARETDPAQHYVLKNTEKKSKTPYVFGLFLTSIALYLKTIFPGFVETKTEKPGEEKKPAGKAEPAMAQSKGAEPALDHKPTGSVAAADGLVGSDSSSLRPVQPIDFMSIETPSFEFAPSEVENFLSGFMPLSLRDRAANDNLGDGNWTSVDGPRHVGFDSGVSGPISHDDTDPADSIDGSLDDPASGDIGSDNDEPPAPCNSSCEENSPTEPCGEEQAPAANRAPRVSGPVYLRDVSSCAVLAIGLAEFLRYATDPDGDKLTISALTVSSGSLTRSGDVWIYESAQQFVGPVTISYKISDGEFNIAQTAHFSVVRVPIQGGQTDDMLLGTMCADDIHGGNGHDNIDGRAGNDVISGGGGNDHIVGGAGDDTIIGGEGNDIIFGGAGDDHISGGDGDDSLFGEQGNDIVFGDSGDDRLSGGEGDDLLSGGQGDDTILDGDGGDTVLAGAGDDLVVAALDSDDDVYDGGEGDDTLDYSATSEGVIVDLAAGTVFGRETGSDSVTGFEVVRGGSGDDDLAGSSEAESLYGYEGADVLADGDGEDTLHGGAGDDVIVAAADGDDDVYHGGEGDDTLDYSATSEGVIVDLAAGTVFGSETGRDSVAGFEVVRGGSGDDDLAGSSEAETLYGYEGDDVLADGDGEDTLHGGVGDDIVMATADGDDDVYDGGAGCDTLDYSTTSKGVTVNLLTGTASGIEIGDDAISGFENVVGGAGDDHFITDSVPTILTGGDGENIFEFHQSTAATFSVMHEILDFKVGDRIRMSKYDLFEEVRDELEDQFEEIYGDKREANNGPIRFSHDDTDDRRRTFVETDFDEDDIYEITVTLQGHHVMVFVEHA